MKDNKFGFSIVKDNNGKDIYPITKNQQRLVELIDENSIIFADGPAGTGKTFIAVAKAVALLRTGNYKKIILIRPAVESGENLGFMPGELSEKIGPYMTPFYEYLKMFFSNERSKVQGEHDSKYKDKKKRQVKANPEAKQVVTISDVCEVVPLAFMRGRTFSDSIILVDEAQNVSAKQMLMVLTRLGKNAKLIIDGDHSQTDIHNRNSSGFLDAISRLRDIPKIAAIHFDKYDIVRNDLIQYIIEAYENKNEVDKQI